MIKLGYIKSKKIIKKCFICLIWANKCCIVLYIGNENKRSALPPLTSLDIHKPLRLLVVRLVYGGGAI